MFDATVEVNVLPMFHKNFRPWQYFMLGVELVQPRNGLGGQALLSRTFSAQALGLGAKIYPQAKVKSSGWPPMNGSRRPSIFLCSPFLSAAEAKI